MRIPVNAKRQFVKPDRLRQPTLQTAFDIFSNPDLYEIAAQLIPASDPFKGGARRQYPDWLILAFNALASIFGGARGAASELQVELTPGVTLYSLLRERAREVGPSDLTHGLPLAPPTREWFQRRKKLVPAEMHEQLRQDFMRSAVTTAEEAGLLDPYGPGSRTRPVKSRLIYADGKVVTPITSAHSTKTRTVRYYDPDTAEVVEEDVPVRFESDAHDYWTGDNPNVTGVKTWHAEVHGDYAHERVILAIDHVPGNKDESNSENHVAVANLLALAPLVPGALGVITDGVFNGVDIRTMKRHTGWIMLGPVPAERVDPKTGERTEHEEHIEDVVFTYPDGRRASVQLWTVRGQLHYKDWDEDGEEFLEPLEHEEVLVRGNAPDFRHYTKVSVPDPREGIPKSFLIRTYANDDDKKRKLNREHWLRDISPVDPRYDALFGRREDAENINSMIEYALPLRRARSYGAQNIVFDLLAHAFAINSVTRARVERRKLEEAVA